MKAYLLASALCFGGGAQAMPIDEVVYVEAPIDTDGDGQLDRIYARISRPTSQIGVVVTSTDYEHTLRPAAGTDIGVSLGTGSFIEMSLSGG